MIIMITTITTTKNNNNNNNSSNNVNNDDDDNNNNDNSNINSQSCLPHGREICFFGYTKEIKQNKANHMIVNKHTEFDHCPNILQLTHLKPLHLMQICFWNSRITTDLCSFNVSEPAML